MQAFARPGDSGEINLGRGLASGGKDGNWREQALGRDPASPPPVHGGLPRFRAGDGNRDACLPFGPAAFELVHCLSKRSVRGPKVTGYGIEKYLANGRLRLKRETISK